MDRFQPKNYILLGDSRSCASHGEAIVAKMKSCCPQTFEGNADSFSFVFDYVPPFDKEFYELKRLQGTAAKNAGRRDEFRGYVILDLNSWLTHQNEAYLHKALLFLVDMSDYWKYIFLVNDENPRAAKYLAGTILAVFFRDHIPCKVKEIGMPCSQKDRVQSICKELDVSCTPNAKALLQELLSHDFHRDIIAALLNEISWSCGKQISMTAITDFLSVQEPAIRFMLTQKEYDRFLRTMEERKENWYGEKEAV